jgi:hypothetical protein
MASLRFLFPLGVTLALAVPAVAAGCGGPTVDSICNQVCDCQGCSESQYRDCVDEGSRFQRRVEAAGCGDILADYLACLDDNFVCVNGRFDDDRAERVCDPIEEALDDCD